MSRLMVVGFTLLTLAFLITFAPLTAHPVMSEGGDGPPWQPVSGPYGGSVSTLESSPDYANDHTLYAGVRGAGVYRSHNGGVSWLDSSPEDWVVIDLALSPAFADDSTLFTLSGRQLTGYTVHGSTDGGASWTAQKSPGSLPHGTALILSPSFASDATLYVLTGSTPYISTDGGTTFVPAGGWLANYTVASLAWPVDNLLFAALPGLGLYRSTDGGKNWSALPLVGDVRTVATANKGQTVLATKTNGSVYRSVDSGDTWSVLPVTLATGGEHTIEFSPFFTSDQVILVAGTGDPGPYRTTDGGDSWAAVGWYNQGYPLGGFVGGPVFALDLPASGIYESLGFAGTSAGIYRSLDQGEHWWPENKGLPRLAVQALALAPDQPQRMLAGTAYFETTRWDVPEPRPFDGNLQLSRDGGLNWQPVAGPLQQVHEVAFANADTVFATAGTIGQHGFTDGGVYRSLDSGETWEAMLQGLAYTGLAVSPGYDSDSSVWVSAATYSAPKGVYASSDGGSSWTLILPTVYVEQIVPSPAYSQDKTLFVAGADGLYRSTNGGQNWSRPEHRPVTALALAPTYRASQTVYIAVQEHSNLPAALLRSTDGGNSWQEVDTGMAAVIDGQPISVSSLAFATDGSVLAGIHYGDLSGEALVYRFDGNSWTPVAGTLEAAALFALNSKPAGSIHFYAATDTGLWQTTVAQGDAAEPGHWQSSGPRGGRASTLAVSPAFPDDGVAFTGEWFSNRGQSESGAGIVRSSDSGHSWQISHGGLEEVAYSTAVHDYAFSPSFARDSTVFAATWGGLVRSTDGGDSWTWLSSAYNGFPGAFSSVAVAPDFPESGHLLAGSLGALWRSTDGGLSWTYLLTAGASADIAYSPAFATDGVAFATGGAVVSKTEDRGLSWQKVVSADVSSLVVSPGYETDKTLFAGGQGVLRSTDGGTTWITRTLPAPVAALAVSPHFSEDHTLFAGTSSGLYRSADRGENWQPVPLLDGAQITALALSPGWPEHAVLLAGTVQGVYRLSGVDLAEGYLTEGYSTLGTPALAWSPDLLLAGTALHGVYGRMSGGAEWVPLGLQTGHNYYSISRVAVSPYYAQDQTLFAARLSGVSIGAGLYRTTNGGANWENVYTTDSIGDIVFSPDYATDQTVFVTSHDAGVMRSTNQGQTWQPAGTWPAGLSQGQARFIDLSPEYPADSTLFAGGSHGFWHLPPGQNNWVQASSGLGEGTDVLALAVSPAYPSDHLLLAAAGWHDLATQQNHFGLFRSTDGGANWTSSSTGLPDQVIRDLAFAPHSEDGIVYLITEGGDLYHSLDNGQRWALAATVPGRPLTHSLVVPDRGRVSVATSDGVWHYSTIVFNTVSNGGFEAESGWIKGNGVALAEYSTVLAYEGQRSAQLGIVNGPNTLAYSSLYQKVTLPEEAAQARLHFYLYPVSGEGVMALANKLSARLTAATPEGPVTGDAQYVMLFEEDCAARLETLWYDLADDQAWQEHYYDLSSYTGQTVCLLFGAYNDGTGGRSAFYVDNVSLLVTVPGTDRLYLPQIFRR